MVRLTPAADFIHKSFHGASEAVMAGARPSEKDNLRVYFRRFIFSICGHTALEIVEVHYFLSNPTRHGYKDEKVAKIKKDYHLHGVRWENKIVFVFSSNFELFFMVCLMVFKVFVRGVWMVFGPRFAGPLIAWPAAPRRAGKMKCPALPKHPAGRKSRAAQDERRECFQKCFGKAQPMPLVGFRMF